MRYLAVLTIILVSTVCFTLAGKKNKCGPKVKEHNCECKDKTAGQLKLADGKLLMCDGSGWKALQYEVPYGKSKAKAGASCKDIKDNDDAAEDGVFWISLNGGIDVFPVYCDMTNGGRTMVFKAVTGAEQNAYNTYNSGDTFNENVLAALDVTNKHPNDYKNRIILDWARFGASEARVVLYEGGNVVKELKFDATGTDKLNWFSVDKLIESPWNDVKTEPRNVFSIQGLSGRNFYINRNYGGCEVDAGWMGITSTHCNWENRYGVKNAVLYSKLDTYAKWDDNDNIGKADVLAVFLQ